MEGSAEQSVESEAKHRDLSIKEKWKEFIWPHKTEEERKEYEEKVNNLTSRWEKKEVIYRIVFFFFSLFKNKMTDIIPSSPRK